MNVNHYCEALNEIQAAWDGREISHDNYLQAIAELGHWYYLQDDGEQAMGKSPRIVFSEYDSKPEPAELPKPIGYVSKHAAQDLANGHLCTVTPDRMLDDGQDWELPVYLHAAPRAAANGNSPSVSGIGRDAGHPRALVIYLRNEPTDDDICAIQEALRGKSGAHWEELESIGEMCRMLEEGEFAEHAGKGPTADRVESCIVKLLGELSEAHERAEKAEESARVNGVALLAEMDQYLDGFAGNAICAGSKLHERIKSVLLDPPAASTTSDQYRAELYDEVWTMATRMGYGNVTDALTALANRLTNERAGHKPAAAIDASGDVITERDCVSAEVFATCCKVATPLFYAYARGVPVYQIRQHGTDEWKTVGPNSYDAAANCPDLARRVAYLPLPDVYS